MIVYHGSNSRFEKLRIHKDLVKHNSTMLNEGLGIYFSTDIEVARSYGKYMYTLELNDRYVRDFRNKRVCKKYVVGLCKHIYDKEKIDISRYFDSSNLVNYMHLGGVAIYRAGREVYMLLDSNEHWYRVDNKKIERVYKLLERYDKNNLYLLFDINYLNMFRLYVQMGCALHHVLMLLLLLNLHLALNFFLLFLLFLKLIEHVILYE